MGWFELGLIFSLVMALYNVQQIKMTLKHEGHMVDMLTGWLTDYRLFKELIAKEKDQEIKIKHQKILNGLHFSLLGVLIFAGLLIRSHV
jgi:hypothetical protein